MEDRHPHITLNVSDLRISYTVNGIPHHAVKGVSFSIPAGETLCLVGESGSGKTSVALSVPQLLPPNAQVAGNVEVAGEIVYQLSTRALRTLRRKHISFVFQDPVGSLIPTVPVGKQLVRTVAFRSGNLPKSKCRERAEELLEHVGLPANSTLWKAFPSELSGGMCQRVMIALALSVEPSLVIADEPTSALDALTQERILDLLLRLQDEHQFGMLCVTHDLRIARRLSTHLGVMQAGELVELKSASAFFSSPTHPYSQRLVEAASKLSL